MIMQFLQMYNRPKMVETSKTRLKIYHNLCCTELICVAGGPHTNIYLHIYLLFFSYFLILQYELLIFKINFA